MSVSPWQNCRIGGSFYQLRRFMFVIKSLHIFLILLNTPFALKLTLPWGLKLWPRRTWSFGTSMVCGPSAMKLRYILAKFRKFWTKVRLLVCFKLMRSRFCINWISFIGFISFVGSFWLSNQIDSLWLVSSTHELDIMRRSWRSCDAVTMEKTVFRKLESI